jgi:iron(III) transport system substrate-binding protein
VVLYCAQDREFALGLLQAFRDETGIAVVPKFDTEANKSVSLYAEIVEEKGRPRCDVFWNNEILSTLRLREQGLLAEYHSPSAEGYPSWAMARDGTWHAFAARARVIVVNTGLVKKPPRSLAELAEGRFKGGVVMARPQFGTTATQTACLFEVLGEQGAKDLYLSWKANGLHLAPGNKQVAEWVARGRTPGGRPALVGMTDTDDALIEVRAGRPVEMVFPDAETGGRMGTLYIPNTLCIPEGCPNFEGAKKLVDFLLSPASEKALAEGPSGQIPLNPEVKADLPKEVRRPTEAKAMRVDWGEAAKLWPAAQEFVAKELGTA